MVKPVDIYFFLSGGKWHYVSESIKVSHPLSNSFLTIYTKEVLQMQGTILPDFAAMFPTLTQQEKTHIKV